MTPQHQKVRSLLFLTALIPLFLTGCGTQPSVPNHKPTLIGHRGSGLKSTDGKGPIGNTPTAIRHAIEAGVDWIEIDVRQSADGILVVFHDPTLKRVTTDGVGSVSEKTWRELQALEVKVDPPETISSFDHILDTFDSPQRRWAIDIKQAGIRSQLIQALHKHHLTKDRVILFGQSAIIREYQDSQYPLAYIAAWGEGTNKFRFLLGHSFIVDRCVEFGDDLQYLVLPRIFHKRALVTDVKHAKPGIQVWTYGSENLTEWNQDISRGADGLIIDDVFEATRTLR
jgi:glycerophosphoryl diester phosphodiesterase